MKKYILILLVSILTLGFASAQPRAQYYTLGWNIGIPVGGLNDYVSSVNLNGAALQGHFFVTDNIAIGGLFGWNTYYQETGRETFTPEEGTVITANQYRYVNVSPMKISANYFFCTGTLFEPYLGVGIGAMYMTERAIIQDFEFGNSQWGFLASPEIGTFIRLGRNFGANVSAAYNVSTNSFTFNQKDVSSCQTVVFNIGLSYMLR